MAKKARKPPVQEKVASSEEQYLSKMFEAAHVQKWTARLEAAFEAKKPYAELADKCYSFFRKDHGFMWKPAFMKKHIGEMTAPQFNITINKASEMVQVFGPQLFWSEAYRACRPYEPLEFTAEAFGNPEDPEVQQMFEAAQGEQSWEYARNQTRCSLMEKYLYYSQREQPKGLAQHAAIAIIDALIKGRGLLWPETYKFTGSDRKLTGLFYDSVDNFYIDPDCDDPFLEGATWIARKHVTTTWQLEEKFNYPPGTLKGHGNLETRESVTINNRPLDRIHRANGRTHNLVVWYEIFSKCGLGTRDPDSDSVLHENFEEVVGDHAYLCVCPTVPWFLNAPPTELAEADDDEVREMFAWPFPSYTDNRWPVAILDFYPDPNGCWPIPPLAPALGELICLNTLVSCMVEQAYENRKQIIAYAASAKDSLEAALRGSSNPALVEINDSVHKQVTDLCQFLNRPQMNKDILDAISYVSMMFDKRTGLIDQLYGQSATQSRSARDAATKDEKASVRPEKMAKDVATWITDASNLEMFLAIWNVEGKSLLPLLGRVGAHLWDELVANEDPEDVVRQMRATVEASDIRKPNKARDTDNMNQVMGVMLPIMQQYAMLTGDSEPLNNILEDLGNSIEQPTWRWKMGPWAPNVPPEAQQMQQAGAQAEVQNVQADTQLKLAQAQEKAGSREAKQMELQFEAAKTQQEIKQKAIEGKMKLQLEAQKAQMDMQVNQAKAGQEIQIERAKTASQMSMEQQKFQQEMRMSRVEGNERFNQSKLQGALKLSQQKAMNKNKPKSGGK
jgi:hypothetical protein